MTKNAAIEWIMLISAQALTSEKISRNFARTPTTEYTSMISAATKAVHPAINKGLATAPTRYIVLLMVMARSSCSPLSPLGGFLLRMSIMMGTESHPKIIRTMPAMSSGHSQARGALTALAVAAGSMKTLKTPVNPADTLGRLSPATGSDGGFMGFG